MSDVRVAQVRAYLQALQQRITDAVASMDGGAQAFVSDTWEKAPGEPLQGNGITRILEGGTVFERAGCGFSHVRGPKLPPSATQHRPELAGAPFEAMGVSLVFHPRNPYVPTVHMNVRMISAGHPGQEAVCWFGGGMDLTPFYGFEEDAIHFHTTCRDAVQAFGPDKYPRFKQWCDEYFYLKHRAEQRGIGGIFYDDFAEGGFDNGFALMQSVGDAFLKAYMDGLRAAGPCGAGDVGGRLLHRRARRRADLRAAAACAHRRCDHVQAAACRPPHGARRRCRREGDRQKLPR